MALATASVLLPACADEFDTTRTLPVRASIGEEMFGVICDRVGAQALREDMTGDSFRAICHRPVGGAFQDKVDTSKLPDIDPRAIDESGRLVSVEDQMRNRAMTVGRVEALGRRRAELIRAFDAVFPQEKIAIKDIDNPDEAMSCGAPRAGAEGFLATEVAEMFGRMGELYNDDTIPQSTQSLARVVETFEKSPEAKAAWARLSSRQGYRPIETGLGVTRPIVAYPKLRDLSNTSLRLLSADSEPYQLNPKLDENGQRIPVPGAGNAALNKLLEAAHAELLNTTADPRPAALVSTTDLAGRVVISRPRDNLETMQEIFFATDDAFGAGSPRYIARRDSRGYAAIASTSPVTFVDTDNDGLPDIDDMGRFRATDGGFPPSPFPYSGTVDSAKRDLFGRALSGDKLIYDYVDTSRSFSAHLFEDLKPLVNPDPAAEHETLMDLAAGLYVSLGARVKAEKRYPSGTVAYDGISPDAALLDLVHATGAVLGDQNADATLAVARDLFANHQTEIARVVGAFLETLEMAKKHDEAKIPREATFWDDAFEITGKIVKDPELVRDVINAFGDPATAKLGNALSAQARFMDDMSYDKNDINGPMWNVTAKSKGDEMKTPVNRGAPITGGNRSGLMRILQLFSDTAGVTVCSKAGAQLFAKKTVGGIELDITMPLGGGSYPECAIFKVDDLGAFYLGTIVNAFELRKNHPDDKIPPGTLYVRNDSLRNGLIGDLGKVTVGTMEQSSRLKGFWTPADSVYLAAKPELLNRLTYFDWEGDDVNHQTRKHIEGLTGRYLASNVCPERIIDDPVPDAIDAAPDKKVHLRACADGQYFQQRNPNALYLGEVTGVYDTFRPVFGAFVKHRAETLLLDLVKAIYKRFPDASASARECELDLTSKCTRQGMVSYEPLLVEQLVTDIVPALSELARTLGTMTLKKCDEVDAKGMCTPAGTKTVTGVDVVVDMARASFDPEYAKSTLKLTDRHGNAATKKNDGSPVAQVTPAYLITNALNAIDAAFDAYEAQHPEDKERRANYRRARSQIVDQFVSVTGTKATSTFENPTMSKMTPIILDLLRSQLNVRCPKSFSPPYEKCTWAREELAKKATETLSGPLMSSGLEVMEVLRRDPEGRKQTELLLQYLFDAASKNDALASTRASSNDLMQLLRDEENLVPLYHVLASAVDASRRDAKGRVVQKSLVDAQMALLARLSGRYYDAAGTEVCKREIDPNQVLSLALAKVVTPINDGDFKGQSPLEVILDVVADVNRVDPTAPYEGTLSKSDYGSVSQNVVDFLTNKERGLEQFYEVMRQGTRF